MNLELYEDKNKPLVVYLSVCVSVLTALHGAHRGRVGPRPRVKAQAHQPRSGQQTLQLYDQVLLLLQLIALRRRKAIKYVTNQLRQPMEHVENQYFMMVTQFRWGSSWPIYS